MSAFFTFLLIAAVAGQPIGDDGLAGNRPPGSRGPVRTPAGPWREACGFLIKFYSVICTVIMQEDEILIETLNPFLTIVLSQSSILSEWAFV